MTIQIENIALVTDKDKATMRTEEFMDALMAVGVGQSFLWETLTSHERLYIRAVSYVLKRHYTTQQTSRGYRVGRLS